MFSGQFIALPYYIFLPVPPTCTLFLYFPALTGNGFACHVMLVTGCVMDGILVRALFCLRHATGQRHPATCTYTHTHTTQPLPHSTCHMQQPARVTLHYRGFSPTAFPLRWHLTPVLSLVFFLILAAVCLPAAL